MALHVEVSGSGPGLLLIPGGAGDAATYARLAGPLGLERTVITYDRRGFSRSPIRPEERAGKYELDVADAARLIDEHAGGRADVFGSSSGAIVALGLVERFPGRAGRVVAHEPPLTALVPEEIRFDDVVELFRRDGVAAAMQRFAELTGLANRSPPLDRLPPEVLEVVRRVQGNVGFWVKWELLQYTRRVFAVEQLRGNVVVAVGADSGEQFPARSARGLAGRLGTVAVALAGDHEGYAVRPDEFAAQLLSLVR